MKINKKANTGMPIFLTIISLLFVIGLLVSVFVIINASFKNIPAVSYRNASSPVLAEDIFLDNTANDTLNMSNTSSFIIYGVQCSNVFIYNTTSTGDINAIRTANYTVSNCNVYTVPGHTLGDFSSNYNVSYNYTGLFYYNNIGTIIGNTTDSLSDAPTYFPIFITIGAILVMILMIVIIIVALKSSGMMGNSGQF